MTDSSGSPKSVDSELVSSEPLLVSIMEKPDDGDDDTVLVPNDATNETSSNCTESAEDTIVHDHEKDDDFIELFQRSPTTGRIAPSSPPATTRTDISTSPAASTGITPFTVNSRRFSADAAAQAQLHALTRETYTMSLRQLRQERLSWRRDKLELDHLRTVVLAGASGDVGSREGGAYNPLSTNSQIQSLLEEKLHHEERLESCNDEIEALKEQLHTLQTEHRDLKKELKETQQELHEERSRQEQEQEEQLQHQLLQLQQPLVEDGNKDTPAHPRESQVRVSMSWNNHASTTRRINDLEEQIHKWEVLYFESAEMGERQIQRLEEEIEHLREELELAREEQESNYNHTDKNNDTMEEKAKLEEELLQWKNRVQEVELEMHLQQEQFELQIKTAQDQEEKWELQVLGLSRLLLSDDSLSESDTFGDRLAALAEEMNKAESRVSNKKRPHQHETERSASPEMTHTSNNEAASVSDQMVHPTDSTLEQEPETQIPVIIQEEEDDDDFYDDESNSSSGDGDIEQYVADLEKRVETNVAKNMQLNELLNQERTVAKNREDALRKQLAEAKELIVIANNRELLLNKELTELKQNAATTEKKHARVVEDLQAQLQRAQDELGRSQELVKELRQKMDLSRQAQILLSESASTDTSAKPNEWEKERLNLQRQVDSQQQLLEDAKRRIEATQRENSQLRHVKDSLMGIDKEMEELIASLEPLQNELAEQTKQAKEARDEAAFLQQELVREMGRRPEFEREIKSLKDEVTRLKGQLNQVYIDLKSEQAAHETEMEEMKVESESLKESVAYYKSSLEILQDAMRDVNDEMRKSSSPAAGDVNKPFEALEKENKTLRADNDKLKNEVLAIRMSMEANSLGMQTELKALRQKVTDLESEMDALELEASMAIQARDTMEESLREFKKTTNNAHGKDPLSVSDHISTTLGNLEEIEQLLQEIEEVRIQASQKQEETELKIRKLQAELQLEKKNASLVVELKKQIKSLEADREKSTPKASYRKSKTKKSLGLEDQEAKGASKDLDLSKKNSEPQCLPSEAEEFIVLQQKSELASQQRLSVKDIIRSKESTGTKQNMSTVTKSVSRDRKDKKATVASQDLDISRKDSDQQCIPKDTEESEALEQTPEKSPKKRLSGKKGSTRLKKSPDHDVAAIPTTDKHDHKYRKAEQECVPVETALSLVQDQKSESPSEQSLSAKDILRSKESTALNLPTLPNKVTHDLEDKRTTVTSHDLGVSSNDSEQQGIPLETPEPLLPEQKPAPPSQQRVSVKDIIRCKESTEQNMPTSPTPVRREEPQRPSISVKEMLQNFQK